MIIEYSVLIGREIEAPAQSTILSDIDIEEVFPCFADAGVTNGSSGRGPKIKTLLRVPIEPLDHV